MVVSCVQSTSIYTHPRFDVDLETFDTPDGTVVRPSVHHPGAVAIVAQPQADHVILVKQYRYALRRETIELPAGTRVPGEAPSDTAGRELVEEAGYQAATMEELTRFLVSPGLTDEELILYRATDLTQVPTAREYGELVGPMVVSLHECAYLRRQGLICDVKTILGLSLLGLPLLDLPDVDHA